MENLDSMKQVYLEVHQNPRWLEKFRESPEGFLDRFELDEEQKECFLQYLSLYL